MGKRCRKLLSLVTALALVITSIGLCPGVKAQAANGDTFTLYYYMELAEEYDAIYMNIWNHTGITFGENATLNWGFGWGNQQAELIAVEGNDNWYSTELKIVDSSVSDGFDLYNITTSAVSDSSKIAGYDNQWNNTAIYSTLMSGESITYAIKDGSVYTDITEAGIDLGGSEVPEEEISIEEINGLMELVPADYKTMGFTADSVTAMETAMAGAEEVIAAEEPDAQSRKDAYDVLQAALDGLVFDSDLFVTEVKNYNEDSIRGVDVSSYLSIMDAFDALKEKKEEAGASQDVIGNIGFKDWDGNVLDKQGFFNLLADSGVNSVRIRVWNDPYNSKTGAGYGGGNNDIAKAVEMGQYVTEAGMSTLIDFHFSDFWADPGKQKEPKAWAEYTVEQKADAIKSFVTDSLTQLKENGVNVSMVQIGNETNGKFCGESTFDNMNILFDAGCDAVKAVDENILNVIHFTNPESAGRLAGYAENLAAYDGDEDSVNEGVSYDVFATSYYPYWHGDIANLKSVLTPIAQTYDKYVLVAETSWANTWKDGDGHENTILEEGDLGDYVDYMVSLQGQANAVRNVANAMNEIAEAVTLSNGDKAGLGFYYWEPAWIPVESLYNEDGTKKEDAESITASNKEIWESTGSGWAASAAAEYDPDDAGMWYGGSAIDNQAVFDFNGNPLSTLNVFRYFKYGAQASEIKVDGYASVSVEVQVGQKVGPVLPETVQVVLNDSSKSDEVVVWNQEDIEVVNAAAQSNEGLGNYFIDGVLAEQDGYAVICQVEVIPTNLLPDESFEEEVSAWAVAGSGAAVTGDDPKAGSKSLHFYYDEDFTFTASNSVQVTEAGYYNASIFMQGLSSAGSRDGEALVLKVSTADGTEYVSENVTLGGWLNWQKAEVTDIYVSPEMLKAGQNTITLTIEAAFLAEAWGTMDCAYLYLNTPVEPEQTVSPAPTNPSTGNSITSTPQPENTPTVVKKPAQVKKVKVKVVGKKMKISWKKVKNANGYVIQYSTSKKFKKTLTKKIIIKKKKTISKTVTKLKKGKKYYVKVRAYRTVNGEKVYGKWSKIVSAKVKK